MPDKPLKNCPVCGKRKLQRLIGAGAGIIFKGSGFYETDYRSESYKKGAESEKPRTDSKKETKTAASDAPRVQNTLALFALFIVYRSQFQPK